MNEQEKRDEELRDIRAVMQAGEGPRRFVRRILVYCGLYRSVMAEKFAVRSDERVLFNAGTQHVAQWLNDELATADREGYQRMNSEAFGRKVSEENKATQRRVLETEDEENNDETVS
jgi:hypothetical protein